MGFFCGMLSQVYTRNLIIAEFAAQVFNEASSLMLGEQLKEASSFFKVRSRQLLNNLSSKQTATVHQTSDSASLTIDFVKHIRFLDLSKTARGKRKKVYRRIYNRFYYGYIYGYTYKRLQYGLTQGVRAEITERLKAAGYNITTYQ